MSSFLQGLGTGSWGKSPIDFQPVPLFSAPLLFCLSRAVGHQYLSLGAWMDLLLISASGQALFFCFLCSANDTLLISFPDSRVLLTSLVGYALFSFCVYPCVFVLFYFLPITYWGFRGSEVEVKVYVPLATWATSVEALLPRHPVQNLARVGCSVNTCRSYKTDMVDF